MKPLLLLLFAACPIFCMAQKEVIGLWHVEKVSVGAEEMTPLAKWFHLYENSLLRAGNGGVTNMRGRWELKNNNQFLPFDQNGKADEAGPFQVKFYENQMTWTRQEEGQTVVVYLSKTSIQHQQLAPWDQIQGSWQIISIKGQELLSNELPFERLYFRWDHLVNINFGTEQASRRSIWRIDAHRPILQLIPEDESLARTSWGFEITDTRMIWQQNTGGEEVILIWKKLP